MIECMIFDMHESHGASFLKASSLFAQLFALLPATGIAPFITVYVWL